MAEIKALQAKKEALVSAGEGVIGLAQDSVKEEGTTTKEEIKAEPGVSGSEIGGGEGSLGGMEGELGLGGSPDSGASSESSSGKIMDMKGKSDAAKVEQLQKVMGRYQITAIFKIVSVCSEGQ